MSPIFPGITDYREIIEKTSSYVDEYWFENLNLRGSYKEELSVEIEEYCKIHSIKHINYFYHKKLVEVKLKQK